MRFHQDNTVPKNGPVFGEIFVFGSNKAGRHGAGAALVAKKWFGATYGIGYGPMGKSFAIPTKDENFKVLDMHDIRAYVGMFKLYVSNHPEMNFFITRIGCGLAGYEDSQIAPLFKGMGDNCSFAKEWEQYLI